MAILGLACRWQSLSIPYCFDFCAYFTLKELDFFFFQISEFNRITADYVMRRVQ